MNVSCPYCKLKERNKGKTIIETTSPKIGVCSDCGSYLDIGQKKVEINSYSEIYQGALRIIDDLVEQFNNILYETDADIERISDEEELEIRISSATLIRNLFAPYVGGTTTRNIANALGIEEDEHTFVVKKEEAEW